MRSAIGATCGAGTLKKSSNTTIPTQSLSLLKSLGHLPDILGFQSLSHHCRLVTSEALFSRHYLTCIRRRMRWCRLAHKEQSVVPVAHLEGVVGRRISAP